jgi:hypothetical protein
MRGLSFIPEPPIELSQAKSALVSRGRKSASINLFILFDHVVFSAFLGGQPTDEPGAEKSDYQAD